MAHVWPASVFIKTKRKSLPCHNRSRASLTPSECDPAGLGRVWLLVRDSAPLVNATATKSSLVMFILLDPLGDMQGSLALFANIEDFVMFILYIQESA